MVNQGIRSTPADRRSANVIVGLVLALSGFLPVMLIVTLTPAVPAILAHFLHDIPHSTTLVPMLVTAPGLVVALLSPYAGVVVDRVGCRRPLIVAAFVYGILGMAPLLLTSFFAIFTSRLALGVCEAFIIIATNAFLMDYFDLAGRRFWLTIQSIVNPLLAGLMVFLSGLATTNMWNGAFLCYLFVVPIAIAITIFCHDRPRASPDVAQTSNVPVALPGHRFALLVATAVFTSVMCYVFLVQGGLAFAEVGTASAAAIGSYVGLTNLGLPLGGLLFNLLSRRLQSEPLIAVCLTAMAAGMLIVGFATGPRAVVAGGFIQQACISMTIGSLVLWASVVLPAGYRGRGLGLFNGAAFAGQFISPLVVGFTRSFTIGVLHAFVVLGVVCLAGAAILLLLARPVSTSRSADCINKPNS